MKTKIKIKLWHCQNSPCDYHQEDEPTQDWMNINFNGLPAGVCPACYLGQNPQKEKAVVQMIYGGRVGKNDYIVIMGEDELDTHKIKDKDTGEERLLKTEEKEEMRTEIRANIIKFKKLEDK